ncbi:MAG: tetratricopeptide repeat protein [Bacteroidia bacterium]|nr:tetratricopeptide repeat protein [Bacteroidia bacterium]
MSFSLHRLHSFKFLLGLTLLLGGLIHPGFSQNQHRLDSLKRVYRSASDTAKLRVYNEIANEFWGSEPQTLRKYSDTLLQMAKAAKQPFWEAKAYNKFGVAFWHTSQFDSAVAAYTKALQIYLTLKKLDGIAGCYNNIGLIYDHKGDFEKAIQYYFLALNIQRQRNDEREIAILLSNISQLYRFENYLDKAWNYASKALRLSTKVGNKQGMAENYQQLAVIAKLNFKNKLAEELVNKAIQLNLELGNEAGLSANYNTLGGLYLQMKQNGKALTFYEKSLQLSIDNSNLSSTANNLVNMSKLLLSNGDVANSEKFAKRALTISDSIGSRLLVQDSYDLLSQVYEKKGDLKLAMKYYRKFANLRDSIFSEDSRSKIADAEARFERQRVEDQLKLVIQENQLRELALSRNKMLLAVSMIGLLLLSIFAFLLFRAGKEKDKAKEEISKQKEIIELKNKDITDSIQYAKLFQNALLPEKKEFSSHLPNSFVFYKPKDIVSGDFYWISEQKGKLVLVAADCTGHGVPGAFMSIIGMNLLDNVVKKSGITRPDEVLDELSKRLARIMSHGENQTKLNDTMDISVVTINKEKMTLRYSGAYSRMFFQGEDQVLREYQGDNVPLASAKAAEMPYSMHRVDIQYGDTFYVFSDGFADQFGGDKNRKLYRKRFREFLQGISQKPMKQQREELESFFEEWKGENEQVDDVLVIGVRV